MSFANKMSVKNETVCTLCLNVVEKEFELIDVITKEMFNILLLKVNPDTNESSVICQECAETVKKCYLFKTGCLNTEELLSSFGDSEREVKLDLECVYKEVENLRTAIDKDCSVCRFCMTQLETSKCVPVDILFNVKIYADMLPIYMKQMDLNITKNPMICAYCEENLELYFNFVRKCLDVGKIANGLGIDQIEKSNNLEYSQKPSEIYWIKQEPEVFQGENLGSEINDDIVKTEELDIKGDELTCTRSTDLSEATFYVCTKCPYKTKLKGYMKSHMLVHKDPSEVQMFNCTECLYKTKRKHVLKRHMLIHKNISEINTYKGTICNYKSKQKRNLVNHMLVHKGVLRTYKCTECCYESDRKTYLKSHIQTHTISSEIEKFKCAMCNYETKKQSYLQTHMLIHQGDLKSQVYKCAVCTYETKKKAGIKSHMLTHSDSTELSMYKCVTCQYMTKSTAGFKNHMLSHKDVSELEMYKCTICPFETKYRDNLKGHMLVHRDVSEVPLHKCGLCKYETKHKRNLTLHSLVHRDTSEVETYKCASCSYVTKYKRSLRKHMEIHARKSIID